MSSSPVINKPGGFNTKSFRENQLSRLGDLVGGNAINGITSAAGSPLTYVFEFTVSFRPSYKHERVEFKANYFEQGKIGERDYKRDVYNPLEITRFIQEKLEEAKKQHGVTGEVRLGNIILDKDLVLTIFPGKKDVDVYEIGKGILTAAAEKVKNDLSVSSKTRKVAAGSPLENRARISAKLGELRQNSGLPIATTIAKVPIEASDNALWAETLRALRFESPVYRRVERVGSVKKADFSKLSLNKNALFENLKDNGYIDKNGEIQAKFPKLEDYKSMNLDFAYESMKEKIYAILKEHLEERYTGVLAFTNADEDKDIRGLTEYDVSTKEFYSIRKGEDVRGFILNPNADIPPEAYFMHRGVFASREDTQKAFYDNKIRFDITVILPAMWGVDFAKTVGHYHDPVEMPEIYQVVSGEVLWLMQKCDEKGNVTEFITVKAKAGDIAIMLPGYGHVSVNLSETEPLVLANWLTWHQSSYYGSFKEKRGAAYYVIKNNQGQPELRPNQEYLKTQGTLPQPQQMVSKDEIPIFGLTRGTPIYNLVKLSDKEFEQKVRFLNYPKQFTNSLIPKETLNDARPADKIEVSSSSPLKRNDKSRFFSETIKQIQELVSQLSTDETGSSSDDLAKKLKIEITPEIAEYKLREGYVKRYVEMAMGALKIVSQLKKEKIGLTDLLSSLDKLALSVLEITDLIKSRDYTEQAIEENSPRMKESAALLSQKLLEIGRNLEAKQYFLSFSPRIQEVIDKLFNEIVLADSLQDFRLEDLIIARDALKNMPQQLMPEQDRINGLLLMLSQIIEQREKDSTHKSANAEEDKISKLNEEIKKNEEEGRAGYEEFIKIKKINMLEAVLFQRKNEPQDSADSLKPEQIHKGVPEVLKQLDDVDLNTVASERSYFPEQNAVTIAKYSERLRPFDLKTLQESIGILQQMLSKTQQASSAVQGLKDLKKWFIDRISSPDIDDPIFGLKESTEFTRVKTFTQLRDFLTNLKAKVEQQIRLEQNREVAYKNNQNAEKAKEASDYIRRLIIELGAITHIKYRVDYELSKRSSSSAVQAVEKTGGIDFRALPMTIKPMGSFEGLNLKLPQLTPEALAGFNLSEEIGQMNQMISGGIIPSGARVQELVAAAWQKGVMEKYQTEILTILAEICKLQEGDCCEASDELKVALVAANAV